MAQYGVRVHRSDALKLPAHPEGPTVRNFADWCAAREHAHRPLAVDLFAGAGGLSAGLENAGWAVAAAVDHNSHAVETHRHNFAGLALDLDLADSRARDTFVRLFNDIRVDLVAGGPPCQPFSRAGRSKIRSLVDAGVRDGQDDRRQLWTAFLDIALRLAPRTILMENVPDMALGDDFRVVRTMVDELEGAGYITEVRLVDAWRFGVPQHRKRLMVLARNDGHPFDWPDEQRPVPTVRDSIGDLPRLGNTAGARERAYVAPTDPGEFSRRMREGATPGVLYDHMTRSVRSDDLEIFRLMDARTLYSKIPEHLRRYKSDSFDDKYKRLGWAELSRSITAHIAKDGYWYIHPEEHRTLTVREAARIQTFPDRFRFSGTRSDAFRQIGNAVPPLLGEAAARALAPRVEEPRTPPPDWLAARLALVAWAAEQRSSALWFMLPGIGVTPPVALAAAVLSSTHIEPERVSDALTVLRGLASLCGETLDATKRLLPSVKTVAAVDRLIPLLRRPRLWHDPGSLPDAVALRPAEDRLYALLCGEDVLLRSQQALRVAARVAGTTSSEKNRLTDGRIDMIRLVGSGDGAPLRMAALRLLGTTHCMTDKVKCDRCPLSAWCQLARTGERSNTSG